MTRFEFVTGENVIRDKLPSGKLQEDFFVTLIISKLGGAREPEVEIWIVDVCLRSGNIPYHDCSIRQEHRRIITKLSSGKPRNRTPFVLDRIIDFTGIREILGQKTAAVFAPQNEDSTVRQHARGKVKSWGRHLAEGCPSPVDIATG